MFMTDFFILFYWKTLALIIIIHVGGYYSYDPTLQLSIVAITFVSMLFNYLLLLNLCIM